MDLSLNRAELGKLPKDTLRLLLGVKKRTPEKKTAGKTQLVQALVAKAKPPAKRPAQMARQVVRSIRKLPAPRKGPHFAPSTVLPPIARPVGELGSLSRVPGVCISSIASHLTAYERVRLTPTNREMQRQLREPLAWTPTLLDAQDGIALKLGLALRQRSWQAGSWWLVQALQKAGAFQLDLFKARYMYAGVENESDSEDEPTQLQEKRGKRIEAKQENDKYNARASLFDHALRLPALKKLCLRGLDASQVQVARRQYKAMGLFHVAWDAVEATYTVMAEDRAPEPLDLHALAVSNQERAETCRTATLAAPDAFWPRRTVQAWTIYPDPALSVAEALLLRDFPMVCKVWGGQPNAGKQKATFHFTCGELPQITKKAARQLYSEVLTALGHKYPHWKATALGGRPLWVHNAGV